MFGYAFGDMVLIERLPYTGVGRRGVRLSEHCRWPLLTGSPARVYCT
jgi:hypothetical protein